MTRKYLHPIRHMFSRRRAIQGLGAMIGGAAVGCGDDSQTTIDAGTSGATDGTSTGDGSTSDGTSTSTSTSTSGTGTGTGDTSTSGTSETTGTTTGTTSDGTTGDSTTTGEPIDECTVQSELTPAELLAKVEHIVVICMENRSFDHYYGSLKLVEGLAVEGLTGDETNPDKDNKLVGVFKMDNFEPEDPPHDWEQIHAQWNGGACDGFVIEQEKVWGPGLQHEVMGYHVRDQLPVLYTLADNFSLCEHWYASLLGPTWPNRYYLHCATSNGRQGNTPALPLPKTIQSVCSDAGISNNNYYDGLVAWRWGAFPGVGFSGTDSLDEFFDRIDAGTLERFVIIDPDFMANDDHPSHNIQLGQIFIGAIYKALATSQYWEKCLLIITYDEHGGFFDHVPPPTTVDPEGPEFAQMGFRVPSLVIGPHVRRGCVYSETLEHASVAATVTRRFGLPELNARAAAAKDVSGCINPLYLDDPQPPAMIPRIKVSKSEIMAEVGKVTSQTELFDALGIEVPLKGEHLERERASVERLLAHAARLGVAEVLP